MSKKRQNSIFVARPLVGKTTAQMTTLSYDYPRDYVVAPHYHNEDQLLFASKGVMTIRTAQGIWIVPPNKAVWIPGSEVHAIEMGSTVLMRTLYFSPHVAKTISKKCFIANVSPLFRELILHSCTKKLWVKHSPKDRRIIEMLIDQLSEAPIAPLQLPQPTDERALRIVETLNKNPADQRTLTSLCQGSGASIRTIERIFLEGTGLTFGRWRQQMRVLHAMRLLASGGKVTTAALDSGYNSPSAFIAVFKKSLGQTPSQYMANEK
ncbi:MAG: helix-turn-helix transcriptional regulator [Proteobacteria bacterium]|nr:helix-turn-helix transcriptional regulator [Pseudomonadota bacterium]